MWIIVNGDRREVNHHLLSKILVECGYRHDHVATALNGEFVHRHRWEQTFISPGDRIEVVAPNAGG